MARMVVGILNLSREQKVLNLQLNPSQLPIIYYSSSHNHRSGKRFPPRLVSFTICMAICHFHDYGRKVSSFKRHVGTKLCFWELRHLFSCRGVELHPTSKAPLLSEENHLYKPNLARCYCLVGGRACTQPYQKKHVLFQQ